MDIGSRIGRYDVIERLGAGGMGVVYRARDAKLNRDVALKVLADAVIHDHLRVARFEREAQLLASLNHPNIGGIYGFEEADGTAALVLELIEGPTLADRLARGPIPATDAIAIARQVADALAAAHERGIVHRDLKPANIKLRPDGAVKVLDFGLAKAAVEPSGPQPDLSHMATLTSAAMTRVGVILGTASYMSPEQATGKEVDRRTDLWAFGVVLFEMLVGRPPFTGETSSHIIADILRSEPDFSALPKDTPAPVRRLLRRCLEKDPKRRLDSAADARLELDDTAPPAADPPPVPAKRSRLVPVAVACLLIGAVIAALVLRASQRSPTSVPARIARFTITPPAELPLRLSIQAAARDFAVAPDGSFLVYRAGDRGQLAIRWFDRLEPTPIDGVDDAAMPFVSPDGRWIGFVTDQLTLKKVAVTGGPAVTLAQLPVWPRGASWVDASTIIVGTNSATTGLMRVPAGGGEPAVLTTPDRQHGEEGHILPSALPGGRAVLFTIGADEPQKAQIALFDLDTGKYSTLLRGGRDAQYVASGHLVYLSGLALTAVRFDVKTRAIVGDPVRVIDNLAIAPTAALNVAATTTGTMVMAPNLRGSPALRTLAWIDRDGHETPIAAPQRPYESARLSPDGSAVAVSIRDQENDIWTWSFARQTLTRRTFDADVDVGPVWTPDSRRIVFASARSGAYNIYARDVDGSGADVRITDSPNTQVANSITPDGAFLIAHEVRPQTKADLVRFRLAPAGPGVTASEDLVQTPFDEWNGEVSPDGRFFAYQSDESGRLEVYVRPYPQGSSTRWQVSSAGGREPVWSRGGRELVFVDGGHHVTSVSVDPTGPAFRVGPPTTWRAEVYSPRESPWRTYDIAADGSRALILKPEASVPDTPLAGFVIVQNWFDELARLVP